MLAPVRLPACRVRSLLCPPPPPNGAWRSSDSWALFQQIDILLSGLLIPSRRASAVVVEAPRDCVLKQCCASKMPVVAGHY